MRNTDLYNEMYFQPQLEPFYNYVMLRESYEKFIHYYTGNPSAEDFLHFLLKQENEAKRQLISDDVLNQVAKEINVRIIKDSVRRKRSTEDDYGSYGIPLNLF